MTISRASSGAAAKHITAGTPDPDDSYDDSDDDDDDNASKEKLYSRRDGAKKLAALTNTTEPQLKKSVDLVKSAFRRFEMKRVEFDCDGGKLGFEDGAEPEAADSGVKKRNC